MKTLNKNLFSVKRANRLLLYTKNILEQHNIKYWLDSGTLLGIYRDGALPSQNRYMTLGIFNDSLKKITTLKRLFFPWYKMRLKYDRSGYKWIEGDITKVCLEPIFFSKKKKFGLDLILKFSAGDYTRWISEFSCKQVSSKYYNKVELLTYAGVFFPIPRYTKEYLSIRYGNWQKVIAGWDSNSHDGAIIDKKTMFNLSRKTRTRNYYQKEVRLEGKNLEIIKSLLADTIKLLEKHGINYWLDCGTLLGIIRDNALIPWDHDADIGISSEYVPQVLRILKMLPAKYRVSLRHDYTGRLPGTLRTIRIKLLKNKPLRLLGYRELHLDIYIKYKFNNYYYWIEMKTPKRVHVNYHDRLDHILWNNKKYAIPSNVEQYLTARFGNWRKPQESYDPSIDDHAIYEELQYKPKTEGIFRDKIDY
ncbi:MAG: LicD family protein [Spirochaetes bacterium]|nr:LicD family protein [Spirochaetota bacterium]